MPSALARLRRPLAACFAVVAAFGVMQLVAPTADALTSDIVVSDNPIDNTPRVLDNLDNDTNPAQALAVVQIGDTVVVGGHFSRIQEAGNNKPILNQANLFAFNATTGAIDTSFLPDVNGDVTSLIPHPDGDKVWVAGAFSKIDGENRSRVALLRLSDGTAVNSFDPPAIGAEVNDIKLAGNTLYIGGEFATVGTTNQKGLATLDATTGALTNKFTSNLSGTLTGTGNTNVKKFDVSPNGSQLVAIGNFTQVDGKPRSQIAVWSTSGATANLRGWATGRFDNSCNPVFPTYMRDVSIDPTGKFFVVVTTGSYRSGQMCDTASRWEFKGNGANHVPTWVNYTGGDTMTAVEVTGPIAYLGGHFRWLNNPFRGDAAGAGAWSAAGQVGGSDGHGANTGGLAAIDTRNGLPFSWHPGRDRGLGVFDFDSTGEMLWAVSDTNNWAGEFRPRVAGFPYDGGFQVPPDEIGHLPGDVWMLGKLSGPNADQQSAVGFDGTTVSGSLTEAGAQPWGSSRGAFMVDNKVYTGWSDGTFTVQTFDGTTFGTPKTIDLAEGTPTTPGYGSNFINDLPTITGMFYDPVRARIYYTMEGSSSLFWRPFQTESRVVGAARRTLPKATALNPSKVRGMFLAGNQLYFGDNTTGVLKKVTFAGNRITGTASVANSSIDWRARGLFLSAAPSVVGPNYDPTAAFSVTCTGLTCNVDASNSADPDGVIASYDWDFGDGQMGSGKTAQNTYAADGPYNITLTVTDNRGSQATKIRPVNVAAPPNQDPTAAFTVSCFGLDCTVNANGSSDLDGTIDAYDWDFGDLQTGTGKNTNHVYGNPGDYTITLTVTDNRGGTDQVSHDVSPIEIGTTIAFRDASTATGAPTSGPSVNIPGQTQVGDLMLMFATNGNDRTADTPNGWNLLGAQSDSELKTQVFWRFATVADLGTSEQVRFKDANNVNAAAPYTLTVASYAGVDSPPVSDFASLDEPSTVSTNDHVSPDINVPADGDWVVSYWADRTAVGATTTPTTIWTAPNNQVTRADVYSSSVSDLRVSSLLTDDDGPALNGARSGKTASTDADTRKATTWTIVLATQ